MRDYFISSIYFLIAAITILILLQGCETWRGECGGEIVVENPIPDTTLYVGGEPFRRNIFESPVVFRQTEDKSLSILVTSEDGGIIVDANRRVDPETERASIVEVVPKKEGTTTVNILVNDGCGELEYNFNVTVLDTTQQKLTNE